MPEIDRAGPERRPTPAAAATAEITDILAGLDSKPAKPLADILATIALIDAAYAAVNAMPGIWPPADYDPFAEKFKCDWPADPSIPAEWTEQELDDALGRLERREQGESDELADAVVDDAATAAPRIVRERVATAADDRAWRAALAQCDPGEFVPSIPMIVAACEIEQRNWDDREILKRLGFDPDGRRQKSSGRVARFSSRRGERNGD
jgi:hypothetical protein